MNTLMRRVLPLLVAVLIATSAYPAQGQSAPQQPRRGDGGLHVSNGGVVGYVGGSGSISGRVVGPGGGGGGSAPAQEAEDAAPNALTGGSVAPAVDARGEADDSAVRASSSTSTPWLPVAAGTALGLLLLVFLTRRLRPAPH